MHLRKQYLDLGIAILRRTEDGVELLDLKDFVKDRQVELEVNLDPGSYIILPRTSGCNLKRPPPIDGKFSRAKLLVPDTTIDLITRHISVAGDGATRMTLSVLFDITVCDIFNKFDVQSKKFLSLNELKGLIDCNQGDEESKMNMMAKF